jgi:hypothetical protein
MFGDGSSSTVMDGNPIESRGQYHQNIQQPTSESKDEHIISLMIHMLCFHYDNLDKMPELLNQEDATLCSYSTVDKD